MNQVTVYDQQDGKWVTGYVCDIKNEETFTLVDDFGNIIGKFDYSLIKQLYDKSH